MNKRKPIEQSSESSILMSKTEESYNAARRDVYGLGNVLNTDHVSKTNMEKKENIYMFENKLHDVNDKIDDIQQQLDKFDQSDDDSDETAETQTATNRSHKRGVPDEFNKLQLEMSEFKENAEPRMNDFDQQKRAVSIISNSSKKWDNDDPFSQELHKIDLIDDIHDLREELEDEGQKLDFLPTIDFDSELSTLKNVKHILTKRVKKLESQGIIDDTIYLSLLSVEKVLNGEVSIAGMKPNLEGLSKSVALKLKTEKQQLTEGIDNLCSKYGIGSNSKLAIQVVISAIKRSAINSEKNNSNDLSDNLKTLENYYENE